MDVQTHQVGGHPKIEDSGNRFQSRTLPRMIGGLHLHASTCSCMSKDRSVVLHALWNHGENLSESFVMTLFVRCTVFSSVLVLKMRCSVAAAAHKSWSPWLCSRDPSPPTRCETAFRCWENQVVWDPLALCFKGLWKISFFYNTQFRISWMTNSFQEETRRFLLPLQFSTDPQNCESSAVLPSLLWVNPWVAFVSCYFMCLIGWVKIETDSNKCCWVLLPLYTPVLNFQ
jgi:hypothetical protein